MLGYCGPNGHKECPDHYVLSVGDEDDAYDQLVANMNNSKIANYARVIMINPLHEKLPRIVLHIQATCNCLSSDGTLQQWHRFDGMCKDGMCFIRHLTIFKGHVISLFQQMMDFCLVLHFQKMKEKGRWLTTCRTKTTYIIIKS